MSKKIGIYKITSPKGRVYIGQSINISKRFKTYSQNWFLSSTKQPKLINSLNKYGADNHLFEIIEICRKSELNDKERFYQEKFNTVSSGLNCVFVDSSNKPHEKSLETRLKISKANKGRVVSETTKSKISASLTGRKHSESTKKKISKANKGRKFNEAFKKDISDRMMGDGNHQAKTVLNLVSGISYTSIKEAAIAHGIKPKTLSSMLLRKKGNRYNLIVM